VRLQYPDPARPSARTSYLTEICTPEKLDMARRKACDIAWERAAVIRGKNARAWRRDDRGNRIRYGSFKTKGKYAWTLKRGKPVSTAHPI